MSGHRSALKPSTAAGRVLLDRHESIGDMHHSELAGRIAKVENEARAPYIEALIETWWVVTFLASADNVVGAPFRKNVARVAQVRAMADALIPDLADTAEAE